jgi:CheY-like chemotaxis protein
MKRQQRRRAKRDREFVNTPWIDEEGRESAAESVSGREVGCPPATTTQHDQLLLEHEILGDHRADATGATERGGRDGQVQQDEQQVPHARVSVGRESAAAQRCEILDSARTFAIRDRQALDLLEGGVCPSVLVLDLGLPDVNGRELLTFMHDDVVLREVPTVVVTATDPDRADVRVDAIVFKPFPEADLVETVRRLQEADGHSRRRRPRMRAVTTRSPQIPPATLRCPTCDRVLVYRHTVFNGLEPVERWDYYDCHACGAWEYRPRTRKLRRSAA